MILDFSDMAHAQRHGPDSIDHPIDDGFVPYLHDYVERAEQRGYSRREIVERLLELLEQVSSKPAMPGRGC
ncbi:MAG: hypothetical protein PVSMB7_25140 [Chloroflexota bacterium]